MTFTQSNIVIKRTFKAWYYEYNKMCLSLAILLQSAELPKLHPLKFDISHTEAEMYYNGGYSPKMVFNEINRIPVGWDII